MLTHTKNAPMQLQRGYQMKLISSGSTENINLLVVLAGIESKFENWPNHYGLKYGKLRSILYTIHPYPNFHEVTYSTHPHSYLAPTYYFISNKIYVFYIFHCCLKFWYLTMISDYIL